MRLTEALIQKSPQVTNPLGERELDLRGVGLQQMDEAVFAKISDDFDVLNLCDNQIKTLDGFAKSERLTTIIAHSNATLTAVANGATVRTPNVHTFVANGCGFYTLESLKFIAGWPALQRVSFAKCPFHDSVAQQLFENSARLPEGLRGLPSTLVVRLFIIAVCSTGQLTSSASGAFANCPLKLIDFDRVLDAERQQARSLKSELLALPALLASFSAPPAAAAASSSSAATNAPLYAADGTRIRRRAREATTGGSGTAAPAAALPSSSLSVLAVAPSATAVSSAPTVPLTAAIIDEREAKLMARIDSAETEEEMAEIEKEEAEISRLRALLASGVTSIAAAPSSAPAAAAPAAPPLADVAAEAAPSQQQSLLPTEVTEESLAEREAALMARIDTAETDEEMRAIELEEEEISRLRAVLAARTRQKRPRVE